MLTSYIKSLLLRKFKYFFVLYINLQVDKNFLYRIYQMSAIINYNIKVDLLKINNEKWYIIGPN